MAAEHLHALKARVAPKASMRSLCQAAGVSHSLVSHYFKPHYEPTNMPPMAAMRAIAQALDCDLVEVSRAFATDVGLGLAPEMLTDGERVFLELYRRLASRDQWIVRTLMEHMVQLPRG